MSEGPLPSDYDAEDGWDDHNGTEQCPHCRTTYSANGGYTGTVVEADGTEYSNIVETDPMDGPFFCASCFGELDANRKRSKNATIAAFGGGGGE